MSGGSFLTISYYLGKVQWVKVVLDSMKILCPLGCEQTFMDFNKAINIQFCQCTSKSFTEETQNSPIPPREK